VLEDLSVMDSFKRSVSVFKKTWGETFVGNVSLGAAALVSWVTLIAITGLLGWAGAGIVITLAVFFSGAVFLVMLFSALQGVFVASLYRYATEGHTTSGFNGDLLSAAFIEKSSR
jgi:Na+-transporting NADH:ubiquinone oxidoreductase subunit NqrB